MNSQHHILKLNRRIFSVAIFVMCSCLNAQQVYFQQEVNYRMDVKLNDHDHSLSAKQEIQYINNSGKGLDFIYFHLWPNAYKNNRTALAKQLLQQGKTELYFSEKEERGFIDSLDFKVNGQTVKWEYDKEHIDICKLYLNEPLRSLDTIMISTPFYVKIPDAKFSRLGHTGQAYFITQWFPKPAVYDNTGWHVMPYLDQGEFYSEFGSFDVKITLPKNYVLAATGDRIDAAEEENFLNNNVSHTIDRWEKNDFRATEMSFPPSSSELKTVRFKQFRVHDFAWFADKRFNVLHDQIELPNTKRIVDTWVFFTNKNFELWKDAITYVNESTIFYSYLLGDYAYNNVNAVDGTIMAGGGMEYPNITVIGNMSTKFELDVTITHEVGHNWFYGMLASNERDFPAMDEGLNSLYEMRYMRAKYPSNKLIEYLGRDSSSRLLGANKIPYWREKEVGYFYSARSRTDQPINTAAPDFTNFNYGSIVYAKTAVAYDYLMDYMGEETFDKAMQFYFEQYKFKHPTFSDLSKTLSYFSGEDLEWFQQHLIASTDKIDYKVKGVRRLTDGSYELKIKNKTGAGIPFNVYAYNKERASGLVWSKGFTGTKWIGFPAVDADKFVIDGRERMPEINRSNNSIRTKGIFKRSKPLQFNFVTKLEDPKKIQTGFIPLAGINYYNGLILGASVYNYGIFQKKFEYAISPMFAFKTKTPVGFAEFNYNLYPQKLFRQITLGTKAKSFAYDEIKLTSPYSTEQMPLNYYRIAPYGQFELKKKQATSSITQFFTLTHHHIFAEENTSFSDTVFTGLKKELRNYYVNELNYDLFNKRAIDPFSIHFNVQQNAEMAKLSATLKYEITVGKKHAFELRLFGGSFVYGNNTDKGKYAFRLSGYNGYHDYLFAENFMARNERSGIGFSQFSEQDGAVKAWTPLGQSTEWLAAFNVKSPRIFILPLKLYADVATCDGRFLNDEKFLWSAGLNITVFKNIMDIYLPLAYSQDIRKTYELNNISFWNKIRFTFNLHKLVPKNFIKDNIID